MLDGMRVVELAQRHAAFAGKLLADLGADVIVVEPPGGHASRSYGPFVDDRARTAERSLYWWHYNTSKRGVVLDLDTAADRERFAGLVGNADIVLEGEAPGRLAALGIDHDVLRAEHPELIWVSVTAFGRDSAAPPTSRSPTSPCSPGGGPVWSCGYDDHTIPPVRGGGNQAFHIGMRATR